MTRKKKSKSVAVAAPSAAEQVHNRLRSILGDEGQKKSAPQPKTKKQPIPTPDDTDIDEDNGIDLPNVIGPAIPTSVRSFGDIKEETLKRAKDNQKHYLGIAGKKKVPWFQVPKQTFQYSEHVFVTVEMAQLALKYNPENRKLSARLADSYGRDMSEDRWIQTSESISFDVNGNLGDGQHRLEGIVRSGNSTVLYITWNVPVEGKFVQDSGKKRTVNEKLEMVCNVKLGNRLPAVCRAMMGGLERPKFSESEIAEFAIAHEETLQWLERNCSNQRADVQAVIAKAMLWYGRERIEPFVHKLTKVQFEGENDPVRLLYLWIVKSKGGRSITGISVYKKTLAAVEHFIAGRKIRSLYDRQNDLFSWDDEWQVPDDAPCNS